MFISNLPHEGDNCLKINQKWWHFGIFLFDFYKSDRSWNTNIIHISYLRFLKAAYMHCASAALHCLFFHFLRNPICMYLSSDHHNNRIQLEWKSCLKRSSRNFVKIFSLKHLTISKFKHFLNIFGISLLTRVSKRSLRIFSKCFKDLPKNY